jgi:hypothetical protein
MDIALNDVVDLGFYKVGTGGGYSWILTVVFALDNVEMHYKS